MSLPLKHPAFVEGASSLAAFLLRTVTDPEVTKAVRAWWKLELGKAPPDLSAACKAQDEEIEKRIRERQ